ncbi:MAG: TRAP transporter TatT component family protein [Gammaproteobacteria bacterium]|nr:TRAP transporter TatT component family protein [Gammaproteobacteria bacterium]
MLVSLMATGCSIKKVATNAMADAIAQSGSSYAGDNDIEFVGQATPFGLKTMEGILEETPEHRGLLLAATRGFTQYAYVYIEQPANEIELSDVTLAYQQRNRARLMYLRARDYGLRGLEAAHPGITSGIRSDPEKVLPETSVEDVPLLYWTAASWASSISLSKDDPTAIADLPTVEALIKRALLLDEAFERGAVHIFLISYEMSQSGLREGAEERARAHFNRALALSGGLQAAPYVTHAEAISIANNNKQEYRRMLQAALAVDIDADPQNRLANLVMQRRARWLLNNQDLYFLE